MADRSDGNTLAPGCDGRYRGVRGGRVEYGIDMPIPLIRAVARGD
ncbi:hypothetical protein [Nocardia sp. SYP-A9097]|nr:hypothetical protein [Nocardia sp. SYP-A9097]